MIFLNLFMKAYNYPAILVSALVSYIIGLVWFTLLFVKAYIKDLDRTKEQLAKGPNALGASVIQVLGFLVMAFVLSWLIRQLGYETIGQTLCLGCLVWLGFVAAIIGPMYAFQAFSFRLFLINTVGYLVSILVSTIILTLWK
jgi:hypothetical protein